MQRRCAACYGGVRQYAAMCSGAACAHAVVCELSPALISCRCGVDQETLLEFYCQSSKLAAKDKAQVGFEAKNCKRVLIICEIVAFFQKKKPIYNPQSFPPPTTTQNSLLFYSYTQRENYRKSSKCLERYVVYFCLFRELFFSKGYLIS